MEPDTPESRRADFSRIYGLSALGHPRGRWRYTQVHEFADQLRSAVSLDIWWDTGDDVHLLELRVSGGDPQDRAPGLYARRSTEEDQALVLLGIVGDHAITRQVAERAMDEFAATGILQRAVAAARVNGTRFVRL